MRDELFDQFIEGVKEAGEISQGNKEGRTTVLLSESTELVYEPDAQLFHVQCRTNPDQGYALTKQEMDNLIQADLSNPLGENNE